MSRNELPEPGITAPHPAATGKNGAVTQKAFLPGPAEMLTPLSGVAA